DEGWYAAAERYENFIRARENSRILFFELGVGFNTPVIIKYPFWKMTAKNKNAFYACVNFGEAFCPEEISGRAICLNMDIKKVIEEVG
ncbi:MAG: NAD-dependent protein deacetylase, partial [Muribaculaceae bacterium]|nr:NAD-dependent protein deacetylase [Muribaculaceae bacterium]